MKEILRYFDIKEPVGTVRPLKVGIINDSYIVEGQTPEARSYFLQRINHNIFQNVEGLQRNIQIVTDHIRQKLQERGMTDIDRRVLRLIPTRDGALYHKTETGEYWRVYVCIKNALSQDRVTAESAYLAGQAFGDFQSMLSDLPHEQLTETIPNFHNIEFRLEQLRDAVRNDAAGRVAACRPLIDQLEQRAEDMCLPERLFRQGQLPKRINHCDTKVNNIMFDNNGRPLCIVDLDTVMPGYVLSDFGDFMRTAANTGLEDDPDLDRIHVNMEIFEAYTRGYLEQAAFLTPQETDLLAFGAKLLSYMQAVRFLTDYLNGDTYYQIQHPEHNLQRTRAQLRLLEEQEREYDRMRSIVARYARQ
ncbi:MAG: aminoglycoside phosphotransferase family protein [Paludibacteraceae bacterium]|nr:aminoglycoside phosphotransferase family protein [Paludibacteraceae bacterium]